MDILCLGYVYLVYWITCDRIWIVISTHSNRTNIMKDKNEFRKLKEEDLLENKPWYRDFIETIRDEWNSMVEMLKV